MRWCRRILSSVQPQLCRALCFVCLYLSITHLLHVPHLPLFVSHDYLSTHSNTGRLFFNTAPLELEQMDVFDPDVYIQAGRCQNPCQHTCNNEWITCHCQILIVPTAARPPIEHFPSADGDRRLQNYQEGSMLICTRESHPSCYYSMLQDDRVTPEGDQVMSRGDTEVGQLLGVRYIIHIHKQHPVVAE